MDMALTDELRAAVDSPPPARYELNDLIRRARRGRDLRRAATGAAGLAAAAVVAGAYVVVARPAEQGGPGIPAGTATAPAAPTVAPSTSAPASTPAATIAGLNATLHQLPAAFGVPRRVTFAFHPERDVYPFGYYNASWTSHGTHFAIIVNFTHDPLPSADSCGQPPTATCDPVIRPDVHAFLIKDRTQRFTIALSARGDGTVVDFRSDPTGTGPLFDPHTMFEASLLPGFAVRP
jgi:hypothetical protein